MNPILFVAAWLLFWAAGCCLMAHKRSPEGKPLRSRELLIGVLALGLAATLLHEPRAAFLEGTAAIMLVTAGTVDAQTGYLFDSFTLPCAAICVVGAIAAQTLAAASFAALAIVGPLALAASLSRGAWLGWGDVKACLSLAIAFGPVEAPAALLLASVSGLLSSLFGICERRRAIPFGPHLAFGATLTLIFAPFARYLEAFAR
jgi:prepilin signal peptidase PulO-like enzyme (type II secretory pathway)